MHPPTISHEGRKYKNQKHMINGKQTKMVKLNPIGFDFSLSENGRKIQLKVEIFRKDETEKKWMVSNLR